MCACVLLVCHACCAGGKKDDMLKRLKGIMGTAPITKILDAPSQLGPLFPSTAHWEVLTPMATALIEPVNEGPTRAPTQPEGEDAPLKVLCLPASSFCLCVPSA
jgi:hypothetical protein